MGLISWCARAWVVLGVSLVLIGCATVGRHPIAGLDAEGRQMGQVEWPGEPRLFAVLPFENLSATAAPLKEMRASLMERLRKRGVKLLGEEELLSLMARQRIRHTGGIDKRVTEVFRRDAGVGGVLITSLELYMDQNPPKVVIVSRLSSTDKPHAVIWADSVALTGDESPGILQLGLISSMKELLPKALDRLADSLTRNILSREPSAQEHRTDRRFRPRAHYRSPVLSEDRTYTIAILPVVNHSIRKNAGELLALHFVEIFRKFEGFDVIEPGIVRDELLQLRIITPEGVSLDVADILFGRLKVDLLVSGKVMDYEDTRGGTTGAPKVTFFAQVIERQSKEVVWASHSTNQGDEGVFFFDVGRVTTAHALVSKMAVQVVQRMRGSVE